MIKMKSDIRREMSEHSPAQNIQIKKEAPKQVAKAIQPEAKEPQKIVPKMQVKTEPTVTKESPVSKSPWTPIVQNKVSRKVDVVLKEPAKRPRYSLWLVAGASLVFLFFAVSFLFAKATVTINPKIQKTALNENFGATKDTSSGNNISFDLISLPGEEIRMVAGGELKDVSLSAKGTVIIYNNYSSVPQRLDIDTRLEGSNGKMYKTVKQITVPGLKGTTPGSIEVDVYASEPGESSNSGPLDFQIFGFKGTPKYSKFYARSKGDLKGGFVGKQSSIGEEQKKAIANEMQALLEAKLLKRAQDLIPEGFVLFPDAISFKVDGEVLGIAEEAGGEAPFTLKGTLSGFLFDEKELAGKIASETVADFDGNEVFISNLKDLKFTLLSQDTPGESVRNITFNLSGNPNIVWSFNEEILKNELLGKSKSEFNEILSKYTNIEGADVVLRPIWRRSFPRDGSKLSVMVNYPNPNE